MLWMMALVLGMAPTVARADVQLLFQGAPDPEYCFSVEQCPPGQVLKIVLATPIVPDPLVEFGFSGPDVFDVQHPLYVSPISYGASDYLFGRYGSVEAVEGFVTDSFLLSFDAPNGDYTGPDTAPVFIPGVYTGAQIYLAKTLGVYNGTVTISDVGAGTTATPEPGTWGLVGTGLLGCVRVVRRRFV